MALAFDDLLVARRAVRRHDRRDRVVEAVQHFVENRVLVGLEGEQRLLARRIDAGDQRIIGAVVVEHDGRAVADISLLHRLADVVQGDRAVDIDQLAMLAQHIEELAEILKRHFLIVLSEYRHPEVRAKRASKGDGPGASADILRGPPLAGTSG